MKASDRDRLDQLYIGFKFRHYDVGYGAGVVGDRPRLSYDNRGCLLSELWSCRARNKRNSRYTRHGHLYIIFSLAGFL